MEDELDPILKSALIALAEACNYSTNAHPQEQTILHKFPTHMRGEAKRALRRLAKTTYAHRHPTGGSTTYNITREGIAKAQE